MRRAVGLFEPAAGDADFRVVVHEVDERLECVRPDDRIGIEQQKILRLVGRFQRRTQDRIVAAGKSEVYVERREGAPG